MRVAKGGYDLFSEWRQVVVGVISAAWVVLDLAGDEGGCDEFFEVEIQGEFL